MVRDNYEIDRVPTFLPRWNSLTFPWLLKWDSRYQVNSKNASFWKINVIFLFSAFPPLHWLHALSIFFQFIFFIFFHFFSSFFKFFLLYIVFRVLFFSRSFIYFAFFLLFFFFPDSIQNSLTSSDHPNSLTFPDSPWLSRLVGTLIEQLNTCCTSQA